MISRHNRGLFTVVTRGKDFGKYQCKETGEIMDQDEFMKWAQKHQQETRGAAHNMSDFRWEDVR